MVQPAPQTTSPGADAEVGELDWQRVRETVGMIFRARKRHKGLYWFIILLVVGLTGAAIVLTPRQYDTSVKLAAAPNAMLPALGNPTRTVPEGTDDPTKGVKETILRRDNLVMLVKQANLVDKWYSQRAPLLRFKDRIMDKFSPPLTEEQKVLMLVGLLEKKLTVEKTELTVEISVEWPNAQTAFEIVTLVQKNFLDARYGTEVAVISDAVAILEEHANTERQNIDTSVSNIQKEREQGMVVRTANGGTTIVRPSHSTAEIELAKQLEQKKVQIRDAENEKQKRINDLQVQLNDLRTQYTTVHPAVVAQEKKLEAARQDPPELMQLRAEQRAILDQITKLPDAGGRTITVSSPTAALVRGNGKPITAEGAITGSEAPASVAGVELQNASRRYLDLADRIDAAKIELDVAKAAFKYRYVVLRPAEVPEKVAKPNIPLLAIGGTVLAFILGIFGTAAKDLFGGRFVEGWQVRRRLRLPTLGEVSVP